MHSCPDFGNKKVDKRRFAVRGTEALGSPRPRMGIIHSVVEDVARCLKELEAGQCRVKVEVVVSPEQFTKEVSKRGYDLILAEYPAAAEWEG